MLIAVSKKVLSMLMSRAGRLAVMALVELSEQELHEWMNAEELAQRIGSALPSLKQVLNRLKRAGLVRARPGRSGGYQLAHGPRKMSSSIVGQAMDGRAPRLQCFLDSTSCDGSKDCRASRTWHPMREALLIFLETDTIQTVAARSRRLADRFKLSDLDA